MNIFFCLMVVRKSKCEIIILRKTYNKVINGAVSGTKLFKLTFHAMVTL